MCKDGQLLFLHDFFKMLNEYYQTSKTMKLNFGIYFFTLNVLLKEFGCANSPLNAHLLEVFQQCNYLNCKICSHLINRFLKKTKVNKPMIEYISTRKFPTNSILFLCV